MLVFQVFRDTTAANDTVSVRSVNPADSIAWYKDVREQIAETLKWCGIVLDKKISHELYYKAKEKLLESSELLLAMLKQSKYAESKFDVAIAFLEDMASSIRNPVSINIYRNRIDPFKTELVSTGKVINQIIGDMEKEVKNQQQSAEKKKREEERESKSKKDPSKTGSGKQKTSRGNLDQKVRKTLLGLIEGVIDPAAKDGLKRKIAELGLLLNLKRDELLQKLEASEKTPKGAEKGDASAVQKLNEYIDRAGGKLKQNAPK